MGGLYGIPYINFGEVSKEPQRIPYRKYYLKLAHNLSLKIKTQI